MRIYIDGACKQNASWKGGAGVYNETTGQSYVLSEAETTNQRMEMKAMIYALSIVCLEMHNLSTAEIFSDSAYILNCIEQQWYVNWRSNGWKNAKREEVKNKDLWEELIALYEEIRTSGLFFSLTKVKGHSDNIGNNIADKLAVYGRDQADQFDWMEVKCNVK